MPPTHIAVAVVRYDGNVLIGKRGSDGPLAGYWEFPGGKVEPGESAEAAAVRETREEAGLDVSVISKLETVEFDYDHGNLELHFFECIVRQEAPDPITEQQDAELPERFRWVKPESLQDYRFPPANASVIAGLIRVG